MFCDMISVYVKRDHEKKGIWPLAKTGVKLWSEVSDSRCSWNKRMSIQATVEDMLHPVEPGSDLTVAVQEAMDVSSWYIQQAIDEPSDDDNYNPSIFFQVDDADGENFFIRMIQLKLLSTLCDCLKRQPATLIRAHTWTWLLTYCLNPVCSSQLIPGLRNPTNPNITCNCKTRRKSLTVQTLSSSPECSYQVSSKKIHPYTLTASIPRKS